MKPKLKPTEQEARDASEIDGIRYIQGDKRFGCFRGTEGAC